MTSPWLSVVMPVHSGAEWLSEALASVAREPIDGIELLILDSSPDPSCELIAESFRDRLTIHYRRTPDLLPWTAKTNAGVRTARGAHVAMLHQDDLWLPGRIDALRSALNSAPEAVLYLNPSRIVDEGGRHMGLWHCPLPTNRKLATRDVAERLLIQNFVAIPAPVIRRDAWLAAGGMDESLWYTADWDLYLKTVCRGATYYSPEVTTAFRIHSGSLTVKGSQDSAEFALQMHKVIERHIDLVPGAAQRRLLKTARTSVAINAALAASAHGERMGIVRAAWAFVTLPPAEIAGYLRNSRLHERVLPRLRARLAGNF